jgi:Protein of unknown function (DUF4099)/Protein of unknown function (DUF3945)
MIFTKDELPVTQFSLLGIDLQDVAQMPTSDLELLLQGRQTYALKCRPALEGIKKNAGLRARLSLSRNILGKAILKFHPRSIETVNSFGLSSSQIEELKAHPDLPIIVVGDEKLWSIYLDRHTNEMIGLNLDSVRAPFTINGQRLTEEQEMRFKLGEIISIPNPGGSETVFKLDPFQNAGIIGRNLDSLEIEHDGRVVSLPYKGRLLIDNDFLLQQELGGLIILEEALKQRLSETHPDLMIDLEKALVEAKEEILQYKAMHAGHISSDEIADIFSRHLSSAGIPLSSSLESFIPSEKTFLENDLSDETGEEGSEKIHWLVSTKNIDSAGNRMLESATGATIIGILSDEEREKFSLAIKKLQESMEANKEVLSFSQLQEKMLALLQEQLGPRLAVYQKDGQLRVSQTTPPQKQQPNISQ